MTHAVLLKLSVVVVHVAVAVEAVNVMVLTCVYVGDDGGGPGGSLGSEGNNDGDDEGGGCTAEVIRTRVGGDGWL